MLKEVVELEGERKIKVEWDIGEGNFFIVVVVVLVVVVVKVKVRFSNFRDF